MLRRRVTASAFSNRLQRQIDEYLQLQQASLRFEMVS